MILDVIMGIFCCLLTVPVFIMIAYILWVVWWMTLQ